MLALIADTQLAVNLSLRPEVHSCSHRPHSFQTVDVRWASSNVSTGHQQVCVVLQVLTAKCLGRRICKDCGKNFNVADIMLPASNGQPEVRMPPLNPPEGCKDKMETRSDDNLETIMNRIEVHILPVVIHAATLCSLLYVQYIITPILHSA